MRTLIIDNYDSFTYNIYQLIGEINQENPVVITNNKITWAEIKEANFDNIIISPGPGNPAKVEDFGISKDALLYSKIPVLGVCLGHQGLGYYYGAKIIKAPEPYHGRISQIYHQSHPLFFNISSPFKVVRYHSLIIANQSHTFPDDLEIIAKTDDNLIMAIQHKFKPYWGVQFHPESICTEFGKQLFINFNSLTKSFFNNQRYNNKVGFQQQGVRSHISEKNLNKYILGKKKEEKENIKVYSHQLNILADSSKVFDTFYRKSKYSFWLDSSMVEKELSRFSYMGDSEGENSFLIEYDLSSNIITKIKGDNRETIKGDILGFLQSYLDKYSYDNPELPCDFNGGFVGYFCYELKTLWGDESKHLPDYPVAQFIFPEKMIIFDHQQSYIYLVYIANLEEEEKVNHWFNTVKEKIENLEKNHKDIQDNQEKINFNHTWKPYLTRKKKQYLKDIDICLMKIQQGESYEICLTNNFNLPVINNPLDFYYRLRKKNPAPYSCFMRLNNLSISCSSPERFLHLDRQGYLESKPIKGTVKRGKNEEEDENFKKQLKVSEKEQAENLMIVDLLRNDLGKVCQIGSVTVPKLMAIETYSTLHQMVSTVRGKIKPQIKPVDCIKACFPGGSMTGAPKKRTLQIINQLETEARGIYSGSIGFLALNGTMDLNIVIRTGVMTRKSTTIGVGGAITALSQPEKEFEEIMLKSQALVNILNSPKRLNLSPFPDD